MFRELLCKLGFHEWIYQEVDRYNSRKRYCNYCYRYEQKIGDIDTQWLRIEDYNPLIKE